MAEDRVPDPVYILGEATRRPITLDEYEVVRSALRSEQPAPSLDRDDDATRLAAEILRFTGGCEKPHRNGERNPHVHIETTHRWGQRLAAIARVAQPAPPLDVPEWAIARAAYVMHIAGEGEDCDPNVDAGWCPSCWIDASNWLDRSIESPADAEYERLARDD